MRNRFSPAPVALLPVALLLPAFVFAQQNQPPAQGRSSTVSPGRAPDSAGVRVRATTARGRAMSEVTRDVERGVSEALTVIQDNYVDGQKLDYNDVFKSSIIGMLRSLDPHSNYYDREEFDELKTDQRSEYFGIGATIGPQTVKDQTDIYIQATFEDSPAARAGLLYGDKIVKVDEENMLGKSTLEVRNKIRGPRGSSVKVTVERASTGKAEIVQIMRDAVPLPSIPDAYMIKPGVGYIAMTGGFNFTTADELEAALDYLRSRGMTSLVLDLRGNPGGFLDQSIKVASKFLKDGQLILTQKGRNQAADKPYFDNDDSYDQTPLVVLINGNSASASEIVAGAIQDHDRGLIVGETSFGKGLVQGIFPLEHGSGLTLTTAKYYTPSGRLIQRDYTNGGFYDYYTRGGSTRLEQQQQQGGQQPQQQQNARPNGPESRTDTGRPVYGGGGIAPDEAVKPRTIDAPQARLLNPLFFFTRDLVNGRIPSFDAYRVQRPIDFNHNLQATDFPTTDALYKAFKDFAAKEPSWNVNAAQLDRHRAFVETQLRYQLVNAAYGRVIADRVNIAVDPQTMKAIDVVPRARELATTAMRAQREP